MSETLETMLEAMPDSYQKTVGFPTYDLLAAAAIPMDAFAQQLSDTERKLDPEELTDAELDSYIYPDPAWNGTQRPTPKACCW